MVTCLTLAIVLGPAGNLQGTYMFFNMITDEKQATEADSIPHAIIHHQESGTIWQAQRLAKCTGLCQQKWNSV
jgi:hypothetical protein